MRNHRRRRAPAPRRQCRLPPPDVGRQDTTFAPRCLPRERLLFTGDHVLEGVTPVMPAPDGDMSAYFRSLDKLRAHDFERIAPGHGGVSEQGEEVIGALRQHRLAREEKVLRSLRRLAAATLDDLTPVVYEDVAPVLHRWARLTLEAHLIKLKSEGQAYENGGLWRPSLS